MEELVDDYNFSVFWKPFQLNPEMPKEGMPSNSLLEEKYGESVAGEMMENMTRLGKSEGIHFNFPAIPITPNTMKIHRLIRYAGLYQKQNLLVNSLFGAYFELGENLGDDGVLLEHAVRAGLNYNDTSGFLDGDEFLREVEEEESAYRNAGIRGVPAFVINHQFLIVGAQTPEFFISAIKQLESQGGVN